MDILFSGQMRNFAISSREIIFDKEIPNYSQINMEIEWTVKNIHCQIPSSSDIQFPNKKEFSLKNISFIKQFDGTNKPLLVNMNVSPPKKQGQKKPEPKEISYVLKRGGKKQTVNHLISE